MKKSKIILTVITAIALMMSATLSTFADSTVGNTYQIENVTVIFDINSQLPIEQQEMIAQLLVNPEYGVSQANLICTLFGHKNTQEGVSTITHKVFEESPRCMQENFIITVCSRCNESTVERASYMYITCCPED